MSSNLIFRQSRSNPIGRPIFAVFVLALLILGGDVYGRLTADFRMSSEVKAALRTERFLSVAVVLNFSPEDFHMKYFQDLGTMGGVKNTTILMLRIAADQVRMVAGEYWIQRIELLPTP